MDYEFALLFPGILLVFYVLACSTQNHQFLPIKPAIILLQLSSLLNSHLIPVWALKL